MLDDLLEWVLGVILEGASEAAGSQRFPMPVRVLLAGILLVFYFGTVSYTHLYCILFNRSILRLETTIHVSGNIFASCYRGKSKYKMGES